MSKICRSCGSYYEGSYCTKCGYGKEVKSKSLAKYKKATKPERFMTDEEKRNFTTADVNKIRRKPIQNVQTREPEEIP